MVDDCGGTEEHGESLGANHDMYWYNKTTSNNPTNRYR
jgi:hypothetical protein